MNIRKVATYPPTPFPLLFLGMPYIAPLPQQICMIVLRDACTEIIKRGQKLTVKKFWGDITSLVPHSVQKLEPPTPLQKWSPDAMSFGCILLWQVNIYSLTTQKLVSCLSVQEPKSKGTLLLSAQYVV